MLIDFQVIPHEEHRYPTVGDYFEDGDTIHFRVSQLSDRRYEWLVFLHELIEYLLCAWRGVGLPEIDAFDIAYENRRAAGGLVAPCGCPMRDEPGDDKCAPYYFAHQSATIVERVLAALWGVSWAAYEEEIESL